MKDDMIKKSGFSLLELSIVLVIIGLIAGGIVAGSSMIRAAELRAVITEQSKFATSVHTFRDKYLGIPGDLKNAGAFWGYPGGNAANCPATAGTGTETCDGDGNNILNSGGASEYGEWFTFWQHLANAELLEGAYTGISGSGGGGHAIDDNVPHSKLSGSNWFAYNWNQSFTGNLSVFDGTYTKNSIQFSGLGTGTGSPSNHMLNPEESWNIDKKMDDGKPATGTWRERLWDNCTDATASSDVGADYLLSNADKVCTPFIYGIF